MNMKSLGEELNCSRELIVLMTTVSLMNGREAVHHVSHKISGCVPFLELADISSVLQQ